MRFLNRIGCGAFSRVAFAALLTSCAALEACAQNREKLSSGAIAAPSSKPTSNSVPIPGDRAMDKYLPMLSGSRVALLMNQTAEIDGVLLVDTLLKRGVRVTKIFVPEHGFRGTADAGAHVANSKDAKTGLPIVSLYGANKKPTQAQLADVDVVVYDLQDVGVRFYTYVSTLQYAMEACAERGIPVIVLDRPNPNGFYIAGPVLDTALRSFVGMQPVPIVYGMTVGEYAKMLVGERWFPGAAKAKLTVIPCPKYDRRMGAPLMVAPSPNLPPNTMATWLYPSLCLFEGTVVSVGRGTDGPFEQWGHPSFNGKGTHTFTPTARTGASKPMYDGQVCYGVDEAAGWKAKGSATLPTFDLSALVQAYAWTGERATFFNPFFEKLAGTSELRRQVTAGVSAGKIEESWKLGINRFKAIRKKYLLYEDHL